MVIEELARPTIVNMTAEYSHSGDELFFSVKLHNPTGETLPFVTAHAVLYEEARIGLTGRFVHVSISESMGDIGSGQTGRVIFSTTEMNNFEAPNMHLLVMVDYRPPNSQGYDMLQAAVPEETELVVQTEKLTYLIDPESGGQTRLLINMTGPPHYRWEIGAFPAWAYPDVSYGTFIYPPALNVMPSQLLPGWQQDKVAVTIFENDTIILQQDIPVSAYLGPLKRVYLPLLINDSN